MVNKIPAYMISAGGKFAILASRSHPYSGQIMSESARTSLESCGVERDDIYIIDCPNDILLPGLSRETARTGFFAAVIALAVFSDDCKQENAITTALALSDFEVPVVPALVQESKGQAQLASAAEEAARAAVELTNLATLLEELTIASSIDVLDELAEAEIVEAAEEILNEQLHSTNGGNRKPAKPAQTAKSKKPAAKGKSTKTTSASKSSRTRTNSKGNNK